MKPLLTLAALMIALPTLAGMAFTYMATRT